MGNNTALKQAELSDFLYTLDEIEFSTDPKEHLFEIKNLDETIGYISLNDLKTLNSQGTMDWTDYSVRNLSETNFKKVYELPSFQRRKPQLISTENFNDSDEEYYLLLRGQKSGPYNKVELKNLFETKEILLTDLVSTNAGHSWVKLFQIDEFDRRNLGESDVLPGLPSKEFFEGSAGAVEGENAEMDAITGLAYLGNLKRGKAIEREREEYLEEAIKKSGSGNTIYKIILVGSLIGIVYMGYSLKNSLKSPFSNNSDTRIGEQTESETEPSNMLSPVDTLNNTRKNNFQNNNGFNNDSRRSGKFETRKLDPVRPAGFKRSFTDTKNYRDQNIAPVDSTDESSYYYNDTAPIELDPVRTQVSRETMEQNTVGEPGPAPASDPLFNQEVEN